jgi:hypothetical protein
LTFNSAGFRFRDSVIQSVIALVEESGLIETRRDNEFFSIYLNIPAAIGPGVYSASSRNKYKKQKNNVSGEQSAAGA